MTATIIQKYFPELIPKQIDKFNQLYDLYHFWNDQINVISRKDIQFLYEHHVLHALGIAKVCQFLPEERIMDVGTGGGFPGIPLAIKFPETQFHLVDAVGKKIQVVREIVRVLRLNNVRVSHKRAEDVKETCDFVVSRAVTRLKDFYPLVKNKFNRVSKNKLKNGILYLKGGDLRKEIAESLLQVQQYSLNTFFAEKFFEAKQIIYIAAQ